MRPEELSAPVVVDKVLAIAKYFRNFQKVKRWAKEEGILKAPLPGETRWNSQCDMLEWYILNWGKINQLLQYRKGQVDVTITKSCENMLLKRDVQHLYDVSKTIAVFLDRMQRDSCNIAQGCDLWLELLDSPYIKVNAKALQSVKDRSQVVLESGSFFAANLLDPRYRGQRLSPSQRKKGVDFLTEVLKSEHESAAADKGCADVLRFVAAEELPMALPQCFFFRVVAHAGPDRAVRL